MTDSDRRFVLQRDTVVEYFQRQGLVPADASVAVRALGGGVSNGVFIVSWAEGCLVAKQPLPDLDVDEIGRPTSSESTTRPLLPAHFMTSSSEAGTQYTSRR